MDVVNFQKACSDAMIGTSFWISPHPADTNWPDVVVEMKTEGTLPQLQDAMRRVEDGHVMLQTLRECPLKENSLERNYGLQ